MLEPAASIAADFTAFDHPGTISPTTAQIAVIGRYPKHVGGSSVKGLLALRPVGTGLEIQGSLVGVGPSETAGATAP